MVMDLGFVGLGRMGGAIAERLIAPERRLHVFDTAPQAMERFIKRGAVAHASPRAVADAAPIVFACLPTREVSEAVEQLWRLGVAQGKGEEDFTALIKLIQGWPGRRCAAAERTIRPGVDCMPRERRRRSGCGDLRHGTAHLARRVGGIGRMCGAIGTPHRHLHPGPARHSGGYRWPIATLRRGFRLRPAD